MRVFVIGYYDDFARFFLNIKKELKVKDSNLNFSYFSLFLSGSLFFWVRLAPASWCSLYIWLLAIWKRRSYLNYLQKSTIYKGFEIDDIIKYHIVCNGEEERERLSLQALAAIDYWEKRLDDLNPEVLILSGDSRMMVEIVDAMGKKRKIKCWYFEQGPFGTTILDSEGVNANASIRNNKAVVSSNEVEAVQEINQKFLKRTRGNKYRRLPVYRGLDFIYQRLASPIGLLPPDIYVRTATTTKSKFYPSQNINELEISSDIKIVLLVLQVPVDINMIYHSPRYNDHFSIVKDLFINLPVNTRLMVREHPLFKGRYEDELYIYIEQEGIQIDNQTELYQQMDQAAIVVVNNSTVGIEAISVGKTVVCLGNSYYDSANICLKIEDTLKTTLEKALTWKPKQEAVQGFLKWLLVDSLIDGHFRDKKLKSSIYIAEKISTERYVR